MKTFLMLIFLTSYSADLKINNLYNPRVLPRDQFYELASLDKDKKSREKYCFIQYLAEDFRQSFWGVTLAKKDEDCKQTVDREEYLKKEINSEVFKISFNKQRSKVSFVLTGKKRTEWSFKPWNYQHEQESVIALSRSKTKVAIKTLQDSTICRNYTRSPECLEIKEDRKDCDQCQSGWRATVGSGCENKTLICSSECGSREKIACSQGRVEESMRMNLVCPNQIEGAICHKGLTAYCYEDIVYCK